jgi:hypothetical protein
VDEQMNETDDKKFENKYLEVAIMLCYFLIPFIGLQKPLRHYLQVAELSIMYLLLLAFIGGNIMTSMIFIMNDKSILSKLLWTAGLLVTIAVINFL